MPDFGIGNQISEGAESLTNAVNDSLSGLGNRIQNILPNVPNPFGNSDIYQYPHDVLDTNTWAACMKIEPYTGTLRNKGEQDTKLIIDELSPIFIRMPDNENRMNYSHNYSSENVLYNLREAEQGTKTGNEERDKVQILGTGATREIIRQLQSRSVDLKGFTINPGNELRAMFHGGARAASQLLYNNPNLRTFRYEWNLYLDNRKDEEQFIKILQYLCWLSAPFYNNIGQIYPALFDLEFVSTVASENSFTTGGVNSTIQHTRCCLVEIDTNYSPGHGSLLPTGTPIETFLTLTFREMMPWTKNDIMNDITNPPQFKTKVNNDPNLGGILGGIGP